MLVVQVLLSQLKDLGCAIQNSEAPGSRGAIHTWCLPRRPWFPPVLPRGSRKLRNAAVASICRQLLPFCSFLLALPLVLMGTFRRYLRERQCCFHRTGKFSFPKGDACNSSVPGAPGPLPAHIPFALWGDRRAEGKGQSSTDLYFSKNSGKQNQPALKGSPGRGGKY